MRSIAHLWQRADAYLRNGQVASARAVLESILVRDPQEARAHLVLGGIAWKHDHIRSAALHSLAAARCDLIAPEVACDVVGALLQVGESAAAHQMFEHPLLSHNAAPAPVLMALASHAQANGEHERALTYLERAARNGAAGAALDGFLGTQLSFVGRIDAAERALESCVRADPTKGRAALMLSRLNKPTAAKNHLHNLELGLRRVRSGSEEQAALQFARYEELESLGRLQEAWRALAEANRIMCQHWQHDAAAETALFDRLISQTAHWSTSMELLRSDEPTPIFIVGLPRSGTTLLDRIVGNHSKVTNAGELQDFFRQLRWLVEHDAPQFPDAYVLDRLDQLDYTELGSRYLLQTRWRAGDKPFYTDKLPSNWLVAGLIARALPQSRILHLVREPMDVCFSNYRALFGGSYPYSYDFHSLASHHRGYQRVMAHWHDRFPGRILDVAYADLVKDAPEVARKVLEFCGLDFETGCADVTRNGSTIATLSMTQARGPIHRDYIERWRPYAESLAPLVDALSAS